MQRATITGIRIRSPADARVIFHSVYLNMFPMVTRRLDTEERSLISTGSVYVWEERGLRWASKDGLMASLTYIRLFSSILTPYPSGIRWGPSRVREGFLFYHEKPSSQQLYADSLSPSYDPMRSVLIKQTYTVYVDTPRGRRKWHLIAYFTEDTVSRLRSIDDIPQLANLAVPHGKYKSARSAKGRPDHIFNPDSESSVFSRLEYVPYAPRPSSPPTASPTSTHPSHTDTWPPESPAHEEQHIPHRPGPASSSSSDDGKRERSLQPLHYLEMNAPPRRDPADERILMLLTARRAQGFGDGPLLGP
ncbi:cAMP-independent regulatory protein pac2 [Psilocybe cubensis]|uniref:cAMP-independent regulatory protein pac2 n=2 Tax=Psilocybe cubensis TaxID=181762 RepID=A0ACB8HDH8_PSICU|nr:cAMP-independent regulatory protein pac2 [Psilocybe cubensis]KAH9485531.1 cAMP-independent regulatory protein pac2 [Psilocybe cubensis]